MAPIVLNGPDGVRELMVGRWGMPGPASVRWWRDHKYSEHNERTLAGMVETR